MFPITDDMKKDFSETYDKFTHLYKMCLSAYLQWLQEKKELKENIDDFSKSIYSTINKTNECMMDIYYTQTECITDIKSKYTIFENKITDLFNKTMSLVLEAYII